MKLLLTWTSILFSSRVLLRLSDRLYLVPVHHHTTANPEDLKAIAQNIYLQLAACRTYPNLQAGLQALTSNTNEPAQCLMVLCGSVY